MARNQFRQIGPDVVEIDGGFCLGRVARDLGRFETPKQLMSWLGLVPLEQSSGARVRRGAICAATIRMVESVNQDGCAGVGRREGVARP